MPRGGIQLWFAGTNTKRFAGTNTKGWVSTTDALADWLDRSRNLLITVTVILPQGTVGDPSVDLLLEQSFRFRHLSIHCYYDDTPSLLEKLRAGLNLARRLETLRIKPSPSGLFHPWTYAAPLPSAIALGSDCLQVVSMPITVQLNAATRPHLQRLTISITPWSAQFWSSLARCTSLETLEILDGPGRRKTDPAPECILLPNLRRLYTRSYSGSQLVKHFLLAPSIHSLSFADVYGQHGNASYFDIIRGILSPSNLTLLSHCDVGEVKRVTNNDLLDILHACTGLVSVRFRAVYRQDQRRTGVFTYIRMECFAMRKVRVATDMKEDMLPDQWFELRDCGIDCKRERAA